MKLRARALPALALLAATPTSYEAIQLGGEAPDIGGELAIDDRGHAFIAGDSSSGAHLPEGCAKTEYHCTGAVVWEVDAKGRLVNTHRVTAEGSAQANEIVWDSVHQQLIVAGTIRPVDDNQQDVFVAAMRPDGQLKWMRRYGREGSRSTAASVKDLALGPDGAVHVVGETRNDFDGNENIGPRYNGAHNGFDVFVLKLTPGGGDAWSTLIGVPDPHEWDHGNDYVHAVAVDQEGRVFVGGTTEGDPLRRVDKKGYHSFLLTLSADGRAEGVRTTPIDDGPLPVALAVTADGDLLRLGHVQGSSFERLDDDQEGTSLSLERLSPSGERRWSRQFGTAKRDFGGDLMVDEVGDIYVASTSGLHDRVCAGMIDRFNASGERTGRWTLASDRKVEPYGLAKHDGRVFVSGSASGSLAGSQNLDTQSRYEPWDAFLARLR